jgi:hypothetical protein
MESADVRGHSPASADHGAGSAANRRNGASSEAGFMVNLVNFPSHESYFRRCG